MPRLTQFRICPHSRSIRLALGELGFDYDMAEERPSKPSLWLFHGHPSVAERLAHAESHLVWRRE